jgi:hypothetical protein
VLRQAPPSYFYPYKIKNSKTGVEGEYITDRLETEAEAFIEANKDEPFFLYFPAYAVHTPIQPKPELAALANVTAAVMNTPDAYMLR